MLFRSIRAPGIGDEDLLGRDCLAAEGFQEGRQTPRLVPGRYDDGDTRPSARSDGITSRGGQGIANIETSDRNGPVVASFPVARRDQIMLVTDGGQLIRCPVDDIRIAGRRTQGVVLFKVAEGERVVSVTGLTEVGDDGGPVHPPPADGAPEGTGDAGDG